VHKLAAVGVLFAATGLAQPYVSGPQVLTFHSDVDGSEQPYALYLPNPFDAARKYPLVVSLHGADSNHRLNLSRVFGVGAGLGQGEFRSSGYFPRLRNVEFIVASPLARGTMGYQGIAEKDVYDMMADVKRRFAVDEDRVYLTGLSMGGGGALWLVLTRPDIWAAVAAVCPATIPGSEELALNALHVPVHLFQGEQDPVVPVENARRWHKRLLEAGGHTEYIEYPAVRHNAWDHAYRNGAIFDWFAKFKRDGHPDRVRFATRAFKYRAAYWVELDAFTPGTLAGIDARREGNRIEVATRDLDGFTLRIDSPAGTAMSITIDGTTLKVKASPSLAFRRMGAAWRTGPGKADGKHAGAEGPIAEAFATRHIYVFGTADSPSAEELARRKAMAERAADWSEPRRRLMLTLPVKADHEVTPGDLDAANLVLFGTRETNRLIARFAAELPVALHAGAADFGLLFVIPRGKRYIVVSSGLPWWTGAGEAARGGYAYMPPALRLLASFGDFILFKGSLANVISEGRFDRNWKLPAEKAAAMRTSGTVTIPSSP
jgi:acetyl esterase/lipase